MKRSYLRTAFTVALSAAFITFMNSSYAIDAEGNLNWVGTGIFVLLILFAAYQHLFGKEDYS